MDINNKHDQSLKSVLIRMPDEERLACSIARFPDVEVFRFSLMQAVLRTNEISSFDPDKYNDIGLRSDPKDPLNYYYREKFWNQEVRRITFNEIAVSGFSTNFFLSDRNLVDAENLSIHIKERFDSDLLSPDELSLIVWWLTDLDSKYPILYPVASLYTGNPQGKILDKITLDEWVEAHPYDPRYITSNPMDIFELVAKITQARGRVGHCLVDSFTGDVLDPTIFGPTSKLAAFVAKTISPDLGNVKKIPDHVASYLNGCEWLPFYMNKEELEKEDVEKVQQNEYDSGHIRSAIDEIEF